MKLWIIISKSYNDILYSRETLILGILYICLSNAQPNILYMIKKYFG